MRGLPDTKQTRYLEMGTYEMEVWYQVRNLEWFGSHLVFRPFEIWYQVQNLARSEQRIPLNNGHCCPVVRS